MTVDDRERELVRYRERVLSLATSPTLSYPRLADYDEAHVLRVPKD
jgi:NAD(P)H dehydrogenase (quinone)